MQIINKNSNPFKNYKEKKNGNHRVIKEINFDDTKIFENQKPKYNILSDYYANNILNSRRLKYSRNGTMYRLNNYNLTLFQIDLLNIFVNVIIYLLVLSFCYFFISKIIIVDCIVGLIGLTAIPLYRKIQNNNDNDMIKKDICNIYILLNSDLDKGELIYDSLKHISENIDNERLKYAFCELVFNINNNKTTIDEAILLFNNRFMSDNINILSACISKIIKIGINENIKKEINDNTRNIIIEINKKINNKEKNNISTITNSFVMLSIIIVIYFIYNNL